MSALSVRDLDLARGAARVLRGVSLSVDAGEIVAVMGMSGGGKTTLLRAIAGLETCDAGTIDVGKVGMVFQFHYLFEHLTAIENVMLAPVHVEKVAHAEAESRARSLLESLGVTGRADALPRDLSGGEAQRVAIARALAVDPPLLLMDEPTASLDPSRRGDLGAILRRLAASGRAILIATHDEEFAREFATRLLVLENGSLAG